MRLPYFFDVQRILECLGRVPEDFNDLDDLDGYGKVARSCPRLEETFGLGFRTVESACEYLRKSGIKSSDKWSFIETSEDQEHSHARVIKIRNNPYKQMALTEYNPDFDPGRFDVQIPKDRLDERQYNKLKSWVKKTYLEEVLSTFKGFVTRVRVSRMEPGCVIDEHIDYNTHYSIRIHIPLRTNNKSGFYVRRSPESEKDCCYMPADGHCWFLNQGFKHSAWNRGETPRDHLVLSVVGQDDLG